MFVKRARHIDESAVSSPTIKRRQTAERIQLIEFVDLLLAIPRFEVCKNLFHTMFRELLALEDDTMLMKLLNWSRLDARCLRTEISDSYLDYTNKVPQSGDIIILRETSLLVACITSTIKGKYPIRLFQRLLEFPQLRDEVGFFSTFLY